MVSAPLYCNACGAANQPGAPACAVCGQSLQAAEPDDTSEATQAAAPDDISEATQAAAPDDTSKAAQAAAPDDTSETAQAADTSELAPGVFLQQRYRILSRLGRGGFGAVYMVADTRLGDRILAVKQLSQSGLRPQEIHDASEAFKREALMLGGLMHPSLPRIYDHFAEAGNWYLVMDFIEGETLEERLQKASGGHLPVEEVLAIGMQLCAVLGYLHTRQPAIIFRDLKPANIMVTPDGNIYLIDFGIARLFKPGQAKDTIAFGSPGYAAPEQYGKAQTTARADIYSLGATLHQMLTGSDPSEAPFAFAPPQVSGPEFGQLIMHMVSMDANKRPASIAEVKQRLQDIATQLKDGNINLQAGASLTPIYPASQSQPASTVSYAITSAGRLITKYSNHTDKIRSVAWSPDGTRIASASEDMTVQVWEAMWGSPILTYRKHSNRINGVAWSPDSTHIVSASSDKTAQIWNASTGATVFTYTDHARWLGGGSVNAVAWSPDGVHIASASNDKTVQVWNATSGIKLLTYREHSGGVCSVAWSPNSKYIASGGYATSIIDSTLYVWDANTRQTLLANSAYDGCIWSISWSPDGTRIVFTFTGSVMKVLVWDAVSGQSICAYQGHTGAVWAVAWSPDGTRIASGGADATVQIWDANTGRHLFTYRGHAPTAWTVAPEVRTLAWSPDGQYIASGGSDNTVVQVWQAG